MSLMRCPKCFQYKKPELFNWKDKKNGKRHIVCSACHVIYRKIHYIRNRKKYIQKAKRWNTAQKEKIKGLLFKYLSEHPCVDCGEKDIAVLDFDHRSEKSKEVSRMLKDSNSLELIQREIAKCEVRCANCHRRKTGLERGYWKMIYSENGSIV